MMLQIDVTSEQQNQRIEITRQVETLIKKTNIRNGVALLFVPHTTAAVTINENADPDVATDMLQGLSKLIPQVDNYRHAEGNSAAHLKSSLIGASEQIIITDGKLQLGTWQGIWFCEFDGPRRRQLQIKLMAG